jgi:hypothetical protein
MREAQWPMMRLDSPTVAGAAPELIARFSRIAPASRFIPRTKVLGTPEAVMQAGLYAAARGAVNGPPDEGLIK